MTVGSGLGSFSFIKGPRALFVAKKKKEKKK
jgi:hypothetical protein